jgi:ferredoxin-NADP reductase
MVEPWRTGRVTRIEQETPNTRRYWIEIPELERFDFKPGFAHSRTKKQALEKLQHCFLA